MSGESMKPPISGICPFCRSNTTLMTSGQGLYFYRCTVCGTDSQPQPESKSLNPQPLSTGNPKDAVGSKKIPLHLWPELASAYGALGLLDGVNKYGRNNFRAGSGVLASVYYSACRRHLAAWFEGEESASDSGVPHLGHALACLAILVDCQAAGTLIDDRNFNGAGARKKMEELNQIVKAKMEAVEKDVGRAKPKDWTLLDSISDQGKEKKS